MRNLYIPTHRKSSHRYKYYSNPGVGSRKTTLSGLLANGQERKYIESELGFSTDDIF
jgi:hypothetical protein